MAPNIVVAIAVHALTVVLPGHRYVSTTPRRVRQSLHLLTLSTSREHENAEARQPGVPVSDYDSTSNVVRSLVSSMTAVVNGIAGAVGVEWAQVAATDGPPVFPSVLLEGLRADYTERNYLWTGNIDASLYDPDCVFTDPTLSFKGLDTFQRNVANLRPILNRLVPDGACDLFGIDLEEGACEVCARWRMYGTLRLPWRPRIDLTGQTRFRYAPERGGRVVEYREQWDLSAAEALLQLVRVGDGSVSG